MARSLARLNDEDVRWVGDRGGSSDGIARASSGSLLPESIPEEGGGGGVGQQQQENKQSERMERIRKLRDRESK